MKRTTYQRWTAAGAALLVLAFDAEAALAGTVVVTDSRGGGFSARQVAGSAPRVSKAFGAPASSPGVQGAAAIAGAAGPVITVPPVDQTVGVGDPATFTVSATGTAPLTYEWYKNGILMPGNQATFTMPSVGASDNNAQVYVIVSDAFCAMTISQPSAVLHVNGSGAAPPQVTLTKSVDRPSAAPGSTVTYTIRFQNPGTTAAANVFVRDLVPVGTTLVPGSISNGGTVLGGVVVWNLGSVAPGAGGIVTFQVVVN